MPTAYEIAQDIIEVHPASGKAVKNAKSVAARLGEPAPLPRKPGLYTLTPEQLLSVNVPHYSLNGHLEGYQQAFSLPRARAMARSMVDGKEFPVTEYSIDEDGIVNATDGQHRTLAAIIAALPMRAVLTERTIVKQRQLYSDQSKNRKPNQTTLILAGNTPFHLYVLDALTSSDNAWSKIVSENSSSTRITPPTMFGLLLTYVGDVLSGLTTTVGLGEQVYERFDQAVADELANDILLRVIGTKSANPLAWEAYRLRAFVMVATVAVRRSDDHDWALDRWQKIMVKFPWEQRTFIRRARDLAVALGEHWNRRLPTDSPRRVDMSTGR